MPVLKLMLASSLLYVMEKSPLFIVNKRMKHKEQNTLNRG